MSRVGARRRAGRLRRAGALRRAGVVIPNLSHAFSSIAECGANFIAEFIESGSADRIDVSCTSRVALPPFALSAR
jgi:hypothetical protein